MAENPFEGSWGFITKPEAEPAESFFVFSTGTPDRVLIRFAPYGDETPGETTGDVLKFIHDLPEGIAISYRSIILFKQPPECTASDCDFSIMKGNWRLFSRLRGAGKAFGDSEVRLTDDDWVGNRPA